jgi:hypothetical protein
MGLNLKKNTNKKKLSIKQNILLKNKNTKKMGGSNKKDFIKSQNEQKLELNNLIENNKLKLITVLNINKESSTENINNNISKKLSLKKKSFLDPILNSFPNFKVIQFYLFIIKIVICVFILPLIKNNFNIQDSFKDMLRNLFQTILKIDFFKNNFTSIIGFLDKLGDFYKPYKYLKQLLEDIDKENEKKSSNLLKKCFYLFFNYDTITKINVIVNMYKNKDTLFTGNNIEIFNDIISLISTLLTLFEIIICPINNNYLCKYISPWNTISIYLLYFISSIQMSLLIYSELSTDNDENKKKIKHYGYFTIILFILCSNINFYKEDKIIIPIIKKEEDKIYINNLKKDYAWYIDIPLKVTGQIISSPYFKISSAIIVTTGVSALIINKMVIKPAAEVSNNGVQKLEPILRSIFTSKNHTSDVTSDDTSNADSSISQPLNTSSNGFRVPWSALIKTILKMPQADATGLFIQLHKLGSNII